jgi:hypothetical protein
VELAVRGGDGDGVQLPQERDGGLGLDDQDVAVPNGVAAHGGVVRLAGRGVPRGDDLRGAAGGGEPLAGGALLRLGGVGVGEQVLGVAADDVQNGDRLRLDDQGSAAAPVGGVEGGAGVEVERGLGGEVVGEGAGNHGCHSVAPVSVGGCAG